MSVADLAPTAVGVKVTLIVQFAPAARVEPTAGHVFVCAKSDAFVPIMETPDPLMVTAVFPPLVSVTVLAVLVVLRF